MTRSAPIVSLSGVGLTYPGPPAVRALRDCNLHIDVGEHVSIVGASGSGKSTLLNVVGLLDRPTEGHYELDGTDTESLGEGDRTALRGRSIGFVFQDFFLLPDRTATENVTVALLYNGVPRARRTSLAVTALRRVGLAHRIRAMPTQLSGGERQRVAIARALAVEPRLLLCDEPTGNLDSETAAGVVALLCDLNAEGVTVVVITHNPEVAAVGDRVLTMADGLLRGSA